MRYNTDNQYNKNIRISLGWEVNNVPIILLTAKEGGDIHG